MLKNKNIFLVMLLLSFCICMGDAYAKSKIKGDPELVWVSPLGDSDIKNNAYNRCRLIKKIKPGADQVTAATQNTYDILSTYASNLYAQAIKIAGYIEAEKEKTDTKEPDLSDEKALLDNEVTQRLGDIARRMNIINAFEASTAVLESLNAMVRLPPSAYNEFRVLKDGEYTYSGDCEDLK